MILELKEIQMMLFAIPNLSEPPEYLTNFNSKMAFIVLINASIY